MDKNTISTIVKTLNRCVESAIERIKKDKTFRPFHEELLSKNIVAASAFERSFSTSFGQGPIEEISNNIALSKGYDAESQKTIHVNIPQSAIDEIERITSSLRSGDSKPNWEKEIKRVLASKKGNYVVRQFISDLWVKHKKTEMYFSLKTVKPNLDQTEIAKKNMLYLKAHNFEYETFFALYYNPGGTRRSDYNWTMPSKIFDMHKDKCVLIGEEYWDYIGGKGTYVSLLEIFSEVGKNTRKKLEDLYR